MRKLGLERIIDEGVDIEQRKNSLYGLGMIFKGIVLGIASGGPSSVGPLITKRFPSKCSSHHAPIQDRLN